MEVKQFNMEQFADTFEGSAADFLKQAATVKPAATQTPPATTPPAAQTTPPATTNNEPLQTNNTLNPEDDATKLLQQQQTGQEDEPETEEEKAAAAAAAAAQQAGAGKQKGGRPVEKLDDATKQFFNSLIEEKKLFGFQDGKLETKKDLQDLLDANYQHKVEAEKKEIYQSVFASMSPAMQFVAQYAGQLNSPSELLPFLQSTSSAERFSSLDENNTSHQELIVRERMRLNGDTDEVIDQEIQDLKDRAKLADKAKAYKPVVQGFYEKQAQHMVAQAQREEQEYFQMVQQNDMNIRKVLDADQFDGAKLKQQSKGVIYELLAVPREEYGGGMGIYHVIDTLFQQGKFDRLAKIALLAGDEKAFEEMMTNKIKFGVADNQIRRLNTSSRAAGPIQQDIEPEEVNRQQTLQRPSRSGFGFSTR